jgi:hypothetical protein
LGGALSGESGTDATLDMDNEEEDDDDDTVGVGAMM